LDRVKKLESNLIAIQDKLLTKANELQHLQVVLSSELSNTAEKLERVNISIPRLIGNVSSQIQEKLNLTEIQLQKSDSNLAASLDEVRKNLTAKINDTIAHVLDTETKLETSLESTNKTLNHKILQNLVLLEIQINTTRALTQENGKLNEALTEVNSTLDSKLNWTTQLLEAKDESILDTVGTMNSSIHAKADAGFAELRITSADTKETISKINTTLLGTIVSEIEELNVDLNSTKSDLKASNIERDEILKTVNTTLVMKISGLKTDTDQLSSSLSASQLNLEKLNLTLTNVTAKIDSVDVLISQLSSSLATSQSNLAKVNETVLNNTQELKSAKQTLMQEDINTRDLISAVNTTLSIKVEKISKSEGPIGPRGFNGSLGATGERGPQGFNGTQGPQGDIGAPGFNGSQGPRGFNGPQGPQGAGNFSQCQQVSDSITGTQNPLASNSDASTQVSIREPSDKRIVGASCSTDIAQQYTLSVTPDPSGSLYACDCRGHYGWGAQTITCIIHYWQCPLTT